MVEAVGDAELVVVATPIASVAETVVNVLDVTRDVVVTDAASIKGRVVFDVDALLARSGGSARTWKISPCAGASCRVVSGNFQRKSE